MRGKSWAAVTVGVGLVVGVARPGVGQGLYPPAPGPELQQESRQMAEAVRDLGNNMAANMGQTPAGQYLIRDSQELQRSTADWYGSLRGSSDPYQVRKSYSGIDSAWHRLRGQLGAPGVASPAIANEIARVEQADGQIHQALNLNAYPANFDAAQAAPTGLDETRRLAYSLAQRGEALASTIQSVYGQNPNAATVVNDSADLARTDDAYYDGLNNPATAQQPDYARLNFSQIVQKSNGVGISLGSIGMPPQVRSTWDAYTSVHNLLRSHLGLTAATPNGLPDPSLGGAFNPNLAVGPNFNGGGPTNGIPYVANQTAPVGQWSVQLDRQVDELLANFAPWAASVPEGPDLLQDIQRLANDVRNFKGDAAQGLDANRLAYEFRDVDADWQRLARRFDRASQGNPGDNGARIQQIGQTCQQIHQVLGMPGYPPTIGPYGQ